MSKQDILNVEDRLCFLMYAASRKITNVYTPILKPLNLTYTQYLVLTELNNQDGQSVGTLCEKLFLDSGTLTPLLKKLEEKGYLSRRRCTDDERVVRLWLTDQGRAIKPELERVKKEAGEKFEVLYEEDMDSVKEQLRGIILKLS